MTTKSSKSVGVVVAGCDRDLHFVIGALESIRYCMPEAPVALVFDGETNLDRLKQAYDLTIVTRRTTSNSFLREKSYGYGLTKMVAFWESPFEEFLYFDSDACAWGDLLSFYPLNDLQMMIPSTGYPFDAAAIEKWFFSLQYVRALDPKFDPLLFSDKYFCTGTFFARRNVFELDRYAFLLKEKLEDPGRFFYGEMGILNYMIFSAQQRDEIRVQSQDFQFVNSEFSWAQTRQSFRFQDGIPMLQNGAPLILHYAGDKPYLFNDVYTSPMRFFRVNAKLRLYPGLNRAQALLEVLREDFALFSKLSRKHKTSIAVKRIGAKLSRRLYKDHEMTSDTVLNEA